MQELARRLGVSIATVSRALNDQPGVSAETRRRVLELSAELDYAPHGPARGLAGTQTHTAAFLTAQRSVSLAADEFYQRVMLGAQEEFSRHGYYLLVAALPPAEIAELPRLRLLQESRVDGVLLAGPEMPPRQVLALHATGAPLVLVDNALPHTPVDCILNEDEEGGYAAALHLVEHGRRQIAVLSGPEDWPSNLARCRGGRRALAEHGLAPVEFHQQETTIESGYQAMQTALAQSPRPDAVFAVNDSMAIGAMRAARAAGLAIPADLAVIGFDDIEWASHTEPPLTTVKVFKRQMGALAARRLLALMAAQGEAPVRATIATRLIVRASCGCAGAAA